MYANREKYVRERMETSVGQLGIRGEDFSTFFSNFERILKSLENKYLPELFFDLPRSVRIISRQEGKPVEQIAKDIIENPKPLFVVHDLLEDDAPDKEETNGDDAIHIVETPANGTRRGRKPTPLPSLEDVVAQITAFRDTYGRLPTHADKRTGLPRHFPQWNIILRRLREQEIKPGTLLTQPAQQATPPAPPVTLLEEILLEGAKMVQKTRSLPSARSEFNEIAGIGIREINRMIFQGEMEGINRYANPDCPLPATLNQLFIDVGVARYEGRKVVPAPSEKLREFIRRLELRCG